MSKQVLNVGTTNNDKTGDTLRAGGLKIKANFDEIYNALGNGTNITGGNLLKTGTWTDVLDKPSFHPISLSGSFDDLEGKPDLVSQIGVPDTLFGSAGDVSGRIAYDANNLYVSTADYTDGSTPIWKYVPWGGGGTSQGYNYIHNQDPSVDGGFSLDNDNPALASVAYVSVNDINGNDIHPFYQYVFNNNLNFLLEVISATNPQNRALFRVTGVQEMMVGGAEYYELTLVNITHTTGMTIGTGVWDLHFDFTGTANTGAITFDGIAVIGGGTASGDGNGYGTLELVPDENLVASHQYLIVDPTAPSHIHIRAGGTQDQSYAELFLGGEKNHVRVNDFNGVRLQNLQTIDNYWYYVDGTDFIAASWYTEAGNYYVEFTAINIDMVNRFWEFSNGGQNRIILNNGLEIEYGGSASNTTGNTYKVQVLTAPPSEPTALTSINFHIFTDNTNYIQLQNNDFRVDVQDDIRMFGRDIFRLANYSIEEPIEITTDYDNNSWTWRFQPDGRMQFPAGGSFNVSTAVPASSVGNPGDKAGCVVFDTTHIYYCTADYGQVGHQVSVATAYDGATALNTNSFQLTKSADTLQITVGDIISDSNGGATSIVNSVSSDDNYTYVGTGGMAYEAVFPLTFTSTDYVSGGNIWKRVAWSNDTW